MSIRLRAIFLIILTNLLIIFFSFSAGMQYVKKNIEKSLRTDLTLVAKIADHFISSEIGILKFKASEIINSFMAAPETAWPMILAKEESDYPEFIGMAVFDTEKRSIAASGKMPASPEIIDDINIKQAFLGKKIFSSTYPSAEGVVFYLALPLPFSHDRILVVTLEGMYFSQQLSTFVIWETGHIFIDDAEGYIIANIREQWVQERFNFIHMSETDKQYEGIAAVIKRMIRGEFGIGYFSVAGVPRICAFRPVAGSEEGWCLGVIAPLPESPASNINKGLFLIAFISIVLNVIAAVIASVFIKKPFEEISALKEAAESNSMYKSRFLATMSHEIRTPMNVILGVAESQLLLESSVPETAKESFKKIIDSGHLLLNIINDILDMSKIEAGKFELNPVRYESLSLINDSANMCNMQFAQKQIKFVLQVNENIPQHLFGDELRIKQILNNLLSNAFKYTSAGQVQLSFNVENTVEDKTTLVISVSDTGQGMTQEQVDQLFVEYARFNMEANRTTLGTGLGMPITKNLVTMMEGKIFVDSVPGKGTTITVHLPQKISSSVVLGREASENLEKFNFSYRTQEKYINITREPMPYGKVLVVDDMRSNLDVAKLLLSPYQLSIDIAESGYEAINLIKSGKVYDIVFMDHMMPNMDGIETAKILRGEGYNYPILALTANAITGQREMFLANGFDGFISKPIDIRQLNDSLNKFVRDKENGRMEAREKAFGKPDLPVDTLQNPSINKEKVPVEIPGVDTEMALALYDGDVEIYLAVLRSYVPNALKVIEKLHNVSEETLSDYIIDIHGLKSINTNIGAEEIRKGALNLELAAKSGNISKVLAKNDAFLKEAKNLVSGIQAWLEQQDKRNRKKILPCPDRSLLARLRKSCEAYDINSIDEVMDELESADYTTDASLVTWLRERINTSDFSSVISRLSVFEEESK